MLSKGIKNVSPQRNQNKSMDESQNMDQPSDTKKSASQEMIGDHLLPEENQNQESMMQENQEAPLSDNLNEGGDKSQTNVSNNGGEQKLDQTPPKESNYQGASGYQETYPMRSTAQDTGAFRSNYAQQRDRESSGQYYRNTQVRDTYVGGFGRDYYEKENRNPSPQKYAQYEQERIEQHYRREPSPVRVSYDRVPVHGLPPRTFVTSNKVIDIQTTQSYGLYEQHRENREQREHVEYQKIQNEHSKSYELAQHSVGVRDRIIACYRAEIESHKYLDRDFCNIRAAIEDLKRRNEGLVISVTTLQGDYDAQIQSQGNVVGSLKNELDILKNLNDEKQKESVEVSEQTQAVRVEISAAEKGISEHNVEISTVVSHNQQLEREDDSLRQTIAQEQELRHRQQSNIYQANGALSKWEQECYAQSSRISVLDKERQVLVDRTNSLNDQLNTRTVQIEETSSKIYTAQNDITKLKSMIHGLDLEINNFEKANAMLVEDQKAKLARNSDEYNMAHDLTSKLQSCEAKYYSLEVDERGHNTDLEAVNYSNQALMDRNLDLKSEYEALQKHSTLLTHQNKDLQKELDTFVETDDIVRRNLDRKSKVEDIRGHVNAAIIHHEVRSRSPIRGKSPHGSFVVQETMHQGPPPRGFYPGPSSSYARDFSPAGKNAGYQSYQPAGRGGSPLRR